MRKCVPVTFVLVIVFSLMSICASADTNSYFTFEGVPLSDISESDILESLSQMAQEDVRLGTPFNYRLYGYEMDLEVIPAQNDGFLLAGGFNKSFDRTEAPDLFSDLVIGFLKTYGLPDHQVIAGGEIKEKSQDAKSWVDGLSVYEIPISEEKLDRDEFANLLNTNKYLTYICLWNNVEISFGFSDKGDKTDIECSVGFSCFNFFDWLREEDSSVYYLLERA